MLSMIASNADLPEPGSSDKLPGAELLREREFCASGTFRKNL